LAKEFVILNAADLKSTSFACYYDRSLQMTNLDISFDDATKSLHLKSTTDVKFSQIMNIYYGSAD
jgi:hypothetical protein